MAALALGLIAALVPALVSADFTQTTLYTTTDCSGSSSAKIFNNIGCSSVGSGLWATVSCTSSTAATLNVFANAQCTGTSTPSTLPIGSTCSPGSGTSTQQVCVTGAFAAPNGVVITSYTT